DASADADTNIETMTAAMRSVRAVEVTRAIRDSTSNGHEIREGDVIAIVDGEIRAVGDEYGRVIASVLAAQTTSPELVTVYRGSEISADEAERMVGELREQHPDTEFEVHEGGQDHYPYVLSLE
ncbi:MAG TPA: DAK2 domain-containing protein, partial [Candidatus Dormibacteraeota bacterium]|nr:DAK2 domain-containing protein [Candidatus Dormibacteraeota bacterium]